MGLPYSRKMFYIPAALFTTSIVLQLTHSLSRTSTERSKQHVPSFLSKQDVTEICKPPDPSGPGTCGPFCTKVNRSLGGVAQYSPHTRPESTARGVRPVATEF